MSTISRQSPANISALASHRASRRFSSLSLTSKFRARACHDWIFSSATNVHIVVDRSAFKDYTEFDSYVFAMSDWREVPVKGIGTVELKIKRGPKCKETHVIRLYDVLHVPSWLCNIFSDVYFRNGRDYEHEWTTLGVQFWKKEQAGLKPWGHTETFCSLDRLVLAKYPKDARSPMLEDKEREVFSVNVAWPQSQRDQWEDFLAAGNDKTCLVPSKSISTIAEQSPIGQKMVSDGNVVNKGDRARIALISLGSNILLRTPTGRKSSLGATLITRA